MLDDTKGSQTITIANGLAEKVYVRVDPLDLVVQTEAREKQFGVGAAISGSANANVSNVGYLFCFIHAFMIFTYAKSKLRMPDLLCFFLLNPKILA